MGIKDFNETLKTIRNIIFEAIKNEGRVPPNEFIFRNKIPLGNFAGTKIAFDASIILNSRMITAHNEIIGTNQNILEIYDRSILQHKTMKSIISFFGTILKSGITPVVVFDGQTHEFKRNEVNKRKEKSKSKIEKIDLVKKNYTETMALDRTQEMEDEIRKTLKHFVRITREDFILMKDILRRLGICCIDAPFDAEKVCAALSKEGIVSAVYGNDTDNYPLGTNILITKIYWDSGDNVCDIVNLNEILFALKCYFGRNVSHEDLIDLCIIHGCDFNERMVIPKKKLNLSNPYKPCGALTGLQLIKDHGRFENFPAYLHPFLEPLNINNCRLMFSYEPTGETIDSTNIDWNLFIRNYQEIITNYEVEKYIHSIYNAINVNSLMVKLIT